MTGMPAIASGARRRALAVVALLSLGQAGAAGAAAFATRAAFAAFAAAEAGPSDGPPADLPHGPLAVIALSGIAIAGLRVAERVVAERVGQDYAGELRLRLFSHLSRLPARVVARRRAGGLALRFVGDLSAVRGWVSLGIARLVSAVIVLPAATLAIGLIDPMLGLAAGLPVLLGLGVMAALGTRFGAAHRRLRSRRARLAADMGERIPHAPELRLMGRMPRERRALGRRTVRMVRAAVGRARGAASLRAVPDAVAGVAAAGVLGTAMTGAAGPAEAAGALAALALMIQPMRELAGVWDRRRAWCAARAKILEVLALDPVAPRPPRGRDTGLGAAPDPGDPLPVRFEAVAAPPLAGFEATAGAGRRIAILGPNGAGKSALLALAAGLETPDRGTVRIGGRRASALGDAARTGAICLVGARSPILAGSLRRALTMGAARRPSDDEIAATAHDFGLGPVLDRLGGLDGRVAEGGRTLSAGEARRLLLARAALSGARLMLLDEPETALDGDGPALVARLIEGTRATVLLATHDPRIARIMDEAWLIEDGRLAACGPPAEIAACRGRAAGRRPPDAA